MSPSFSHTWTCAFVTIPLNRRCHTTFLETTFHCDGGQRLYSQRYCCAISKRLTQHNQKFFNGPSSSHNGMPPVVQWHPVSNAKVAVAELVHRVKLMLGMIDEGEISISAYDTAWVALVEDVNGNGAPQFPKTIEWIATNQLSDGSWGDSSIFQAHDRLINTLGCVVALKSWNVHHDICGKGIAYFKNNLHKLEDANDEQMPIGFEVAFPSLIEIGRALGIDIPDDAPVLEAIYAKRNLKLERIPKDIMHKLPTTLLHSLEGMPGLNWGDLLKLQSQDGSFLFSPSSTAYALMQTKDENCLNYLSRIVKRFDGGVPNVYPVDLFERTWVVDRLQRLGLARYFPVEIDRCLSYVNRFWTPNGICWARNSAVNDIDDTAMAFRLLRLHGFDVSADVFKHFENGDEFVCFKGQSTQAVTGMLNLYRASQVSFPGESILEKARKFSSTFLLEKQAANQVLDKWIITKDLPGEVSYSLNVPWHANLPRVEARFYIDHYGGNDDVWIGKTLYRMAIVNNDTYLRLAKMDYNHCQTIHLAEWNSLQKWYDVSDLHSFGVTRQNLLVAYFVAAASSFEPERARQRLAWAKTTALIDAISNFFRGQGSEHRTGFTQEFLNSCISVMSRRMSTSNSGDKLVNLLVETLDQLAVDALVTNGLDIGPSILHAWRKWLAAWSADGERHLGEAELLVQTLLLTSGQARDSQHHEYDKLTQLSNSLCFQLGKYQINKVGGSNDNGNKPSDSMATLEIDSDMQKLAQLVFQKSSDGLDPIVKQEFWTVTRAFYYLADSTPETISYHIAKVLFEKVVH